jgi:hypothetical protein
MTATTDRDSAIAQAIAALEPFAKMARALPTMGAEVPIYSVRIDGENSTRITVGDLRQTLHAFASLRVLAPAPAGTSPAPFAFQIGATVFKHRGSYKLHGTVRAHFFTKDGDPRYVVDHEPTVPGLLHIYNEEQLMAAAPADQSDKTHLSGFHPETCNQQESLMSNIDDGKELTWNITNAQNFVEGVNNDARRDLAAAVMEAVAIVKSDDPQYIVIRITAE